MNITTLETRQTSDTRHSQLMIEGKYGTMRALMSERPDAYGIGPVVVHNIGFLQSTRDASVRDIHREVFRRLGASRMITVSNNGIDIEHGKDMATREQTARDKYELFCRFADAAGAFAVGTSMGAKNHVDMLHLSLRDNYRVPLRGGTWISPGSVHSAYSAQRCNELPTNLLLTGTRWIAQNSLSMLAYYGPHLLSLGQATDELTEIPRIGFRLLQNNQPIQHQRSMTEEGTHPEVTHAVAEAYSGLLHVIAGTEDVMYDRPVLSATPHIRTTELHGGHELGILPPVATRSIVDSIVEFQAKETPLRAA